MDAVTERAPLSRKLSAIAESATLAVDASFQHYAGGIWTSAACAGELGAGGNPK